MKLLGGKEMTTINYERGTSKGGITINNYSGVTYIAVTAAASKTFKSLKGAEKFMAERGYKKA
jgi:hypothetical protein